MLQGLREISGLAAKVISAEASIAPETSIKRSPIAAAATGFA
jgi:hypothetical protein